MLGGEGRSVLISKSQFFICLYGRGRKWVSHFEVLRLGSDNFSLFPIHSNGCPRSNIFHLLTPLPPNSVSTFCKAALPGLQRCSGNIVRWRSYFYPLPTNEVGGGYRNGFRPSVRHISFPELNYKSPQDIFTKFGTHIKQVVNSCLLMFTDLKNIYFTMAGDIEDFVFNGC